MARIVTTSGVAALAHDGKVYRPDRKGVFTVPDDLVEAFLSHGFATLGTGDAKNAVGNTGGSGA